MKKINILKNSYDFGASSLLHNPIINPENNYKDLIKNNKPYKFRDYIIYIERETGDLYKFGFSVGKKVGNAVTRNKVKRQLKSIVDKKDYQNGFNCIIIVGNGILKRSYIDMQNNLFNALNNLNIFKEENND